VPDRTHALFDGLPEDELAVILGELERRRYPAGSVVIAEGDRPNELYITQSGRAEVLITDRHGAIHQVARLRPGTPFGEMSLFTGQPAGSTVRATEDLEVLVMGGDEFERFADRHPRVYRNLGAILAERLNRTNRLAMQDAPGRLIVLRDWGAPPLVAFGLAASVAWHTRCPTLLLVIADEVPAELEALSGTATADGAAPRAHIITVPTLGHLRADSLTGRIDDLFRRFEHILVLAQRDGDEHELRTARTITLATPELSLRRGGDDTRVVRAWSRGTGATPGRAGVTHVPPLTPADEEALRGGLLPARTPTGKALGWQARDLTGLKVGVALGAGSLRGYAHVGVLHALNRAGVEVDYLAGTSIGAAVAGLYALGLRGGEIIDCLDQAGGAAFRPTLPVSSLLSSRALARYINSVGKGQRIEDLPVPLALVAADMLTQREVVFQRGSLALAVVASASIPGIYPPQRVGPYMLVDGGVLNPVPASVTAEMGADVLIAIRLGAPTIGAETEVVAEAAAGRAPSVISVILRSIEIMQSRVAHEVADRTTITITPKLDEVPGAKLRNFKVGNRYVAAGAEAVYEALPRIAAALPWVRRG
jgi:NTE family protein